MFANLGELMEGAPQFDYMRLISPKKQERPAALHESAPGLTPGVSFFDSRLDPGVRAAQACPSPRRVDLRGWR